MNAEKPKYYSSTVVCFTLVDLLELKKNSKRPSSGIVIGAFRSNLLLSILMKNKQIF